MKPKILVVDDVSDSWHVVSSILRTHHYQPIWAADSTRAMIEARKFQPAAILLYLGLPDRESFILLERLKQNQPLSKIPVIVVAGHDPSDGTTGQRTWSGRIPSKTFKGRQADQNDQSSPQSESVSSIQKGDRMAGFVMRKNQRFKELVPVQYRGEGIAGEGMLKDLSLNGGSITGTLPVRVGMALGLHMFVPGDPEPLLIDRAV